ncbi:MFS transporter, CP family, cyanate transporter [Pseudomonas sp. LAMO17WK12:I10]|nr:CP family cyanate transporter-like MFS transporter [Pseudomonas sp. LAMO17WK12:I9]SNY04129.1 MFS transporter, CP family, cyanate transporter [Pseudomonas sp. LAMO17WK12:I10]
MCGGGGRELTGSFISAWWVLVLSVLAMLVLTRVFSPSSYREPQMATTAAQPASVTP